MVGEVALRAARGPGARRGSRQGVAEGSPELNTGEWEPFLREDSCW